MNTRRMAAILTALNLFLFTNLATPDVRSPTHSFTTLDVPGATSTDARSINASGQVTGFYTDSSGNHGFVYGGTFTTLDVPGADGGTYPASINASGQVAGGYSDGSRDHGFVYSNGTFTALNVPGATTYTQVTSINASGQVTGYYWDGSGGHGFVYSNGTFTTFDVPDAYSTYPTSINDTGQVTGYGLRRSSGTSTPNPFSDGFVYSDGAFTILDVPGAAGGTYPASINASGQVTGKYCKGLYHGPADCHGFVYGDSTFTIFDGPGATYTSAASINASGQVTGSYSGHGFVYTDGAFTTLDVPGTASTSPTSINESGQVTGNYYYAGNPSRQYGFIATPICTTPTVTVHTLTTMPQGKLRITGSITHEGAPLCALVLANGQFMFTCGDPLPKGDFDLTAPLDDQGQITLFGFSAGLAPFQQSLEPGALPASIDGKGCVTPKVRHTITAAPEGGFRITGSITQEGAPLCALVLANGQFMFTCGDPLPKGYFDLTVPLNDQGQITLFGFAADSTPFQQIFAPTPSTFP